jgi:hypothetical protein
VVVARLADARIARAATRRRSIATLDVRTRAEWRAWLARNHTAVAEIWLVFHKRHTAKRSVDYEGAVEEALCFGWIDSLVRRLDDDRYARKFTPRTAQSRWSASNRRRYAAVEARGLLTEAGRARPPGAAPWRRRRDWPMRPLEQPSKPRRRGLTSGAHALAATEIRRLDRFGQARDEERR